MEHLTITDTPPGCPLDTVELDCERLPLHFKGTDATEQSYSLRAFIPKTVNGGRDYIDFYAERLALAHESSEGTEREFYSWVIRMMAARLDMDSIDVKHRRRFNIRTLTAHRDHAKRTTFDRIREIMGPERLTNLDFMLRLARDPSGDLHEPIANALYEDPQISTLLSETAHAEFEEQMIEDMLRLKAEVSRLAANEIKGVRRRIRTNRSLSPTERREALRRLKGEAARLVNGMVAESISETIAHEEQYTSRFKPFVEEARRIHDEVGPLLVAAGMIADDGRINAEESEARDFMRKHLQSESVDAVLDCFLQRLREVHGLIPSELAEYDPERREEIPDDDTRAIATQHHHAFSYLRQSSDPMDKWRAVCGLLTTFANRNGSIRLFQRKCDEVVIGIVDGAHREIYRAIREHLTRPERRLFLLMHCSLPSFGGRIAVMDAPIQSFYWGMNNETQALVWLVSVFGLRSWGDEKNLDKELARRFQAYLRFYPYWVFTSREDEKESKRANRHVFNEVPIWEPVVFEKGGEMLREQMVPAPEPAKDDPFRAFVCAGTATAREWIEKYCRPADVPRMIKYCEGGLSETEIARQEGVTQQAISLAVRRGLQDIGRGLVRDQPEQFGDFSL